MIRKILLFVFAINCLGNAQNLPPGFTILEVAEDLEAMTSMAFVDADTILLASQNGEIFLFDNGVVDSEPIVRIPTLVSTVGGDRGLVAIKMDPDYPTSPYVYVTYTLEDASRNVVSRFTFQNNTIDLGSEEVLLELSPLTAIWHTGGAIVFDDQGHLFTTTGDNSSNPAIAQDMNSTHGKVHRINKDGSIPTDNPFFGGPNTIDDTVWTVGYRNPFTMAIHKATNVIYVNDVGKFDYEEINNSTGPAGNFGWPDEEGYLALDPSPYDAPSYAYIHPPGAPTDSTGYAITGGAFYDPEVPKYPDEYVDKYFFLDYVAKWINYVDPSSNLEPGHHHHIHDLSHTRQTFATNIKESAISLTLSPDGYLYWLTRFQKKLYKLVFYDGDEPIILSHPQNTTTMIGESTLFKVIAQGAADLNYEWYRDGNLLGSAPNSGNYSWGNTQENREGEYQVRVYNSYGEVWSPTWTLDVIPFNEAPEVSISQPMDAVEYQAGETISFSANATDTEEGLLDDDRFSWFVVFHHDDHIHDGPAFATEVSSGTFQIPDVGESDHNVWYEFVARVEDDLGQVAEDNVFIYPKKSTVTFLTNPINLQVNIDGPSYNTPNDVLFVEHMNIPVSAPDFQMIQGDDAIYRLSGWSSSVTGDLLLVPEEDFTLTANFQRCTNPNEVENFDFSYSESEDQLQLSWNSTETPCIKGFEIEYLNDNSLFFIDAYREQNSYGYVIPGFDATQDIDHDFRIKSYNEYGESIYIYLSFNLLSLDEFSFNDLRVFPNPVKNQIIVPSLGLDNNLDLQLFNVFGQKLNNLEWTTVNGDLYGDMSSLNSGTYILKIRQGAREKIFKVIKT